MVLLMESEKESVPEYDLPPELWLQILWKYPLRDLVKFRCVCKTWCFIIDHHPPLFLQILVRLPVKTLLRFRCVCKTWCSIIDDPDFFSMHMTAFKNHYGKRFMLSYENYSPCEKDGIGKGLRSKIYTRISDTFLTIEKLWAVTCPPSTEFNRYYRYEGYMDGMFLVQNHKDMALWNPSSRKILELPPLPEGNYHPFEFKFLGYDPSTRDYKVVAIVRIDSSQDIDVPRYLAVYTLQSGCWKIDFGLSRDQIFMKIYNWWYRMSNMVFSKGVAHWLGKYKHWSCGDSQAKGYSCMISFDFASETFSCTRLPNDGHDSHERIALPFHHGDSLAVFSISPGRSSISVMEDYGMSELWGQQYARDAHLDSYEFFLRRYKRIKILYLEKDHKLLILDDKQVRSYDLESHALAVLGNHCWLQVNMEPYVESLLLCKELSGQTITDTHPQFEVFSDERC